MPTVATILEECALYAPTNGARRWLREHAGQRVVVIRYPKRIYPESYTVKADDGTQGYPYPNELRELHYEKPRKPANDDPKQPSLFQKESCNDRTHTNDAKRSRAPASPLAPQQAAGKNRRP